jgi:hypothetical protein
MAGCWGKQQNITKTQNTNKTTLAGKEHKELPGKSGKSPKTHRDPPTTN